MGYPDGIFRANAPVSRAEFAALATRFRELTASDCSYPDVPADFWAIAERELVSQNDVLRLLQVPLS